eukprot:7020263-Prymnesium_polylepis.1
MDRSSKSHSRSSTVCRDCRVSDEVSLTTRGAKAATSACSDHAQMHWHSLPAARGCEVGRPRRRAAAHPPL